MTLVNWLLAGSISMAMMYTGLLFDPSWANLTFVRDKLRPFAALAAVNYLAVPLLTTAVVATLPVNGTLALSLMTLSALPCAPLVPALVTLAGEPPEWPLFVFLGFSALSLLFVILLIAALANSGTYGENIRQDTATKLLQYVLMVYGPMALGALGRKLAPATATRLLGPVRALTGLSLVIFLVLFSIVHKHEFFSIGQVELCLILGFVSYCTLLGSLSGNRFAGPWLTATISTCFRNIALGIAFATVVLRRPDVTAYLVVYSAVTLPVCGALLLVHKWAARQVVSD